MALKLKKEVKKSSYYVWFLGAKESKGLRGLEYIVPVIDNLEEREKDIEPFKVTLQVSTKGLKIVQNIVSAQSNKKPKNETIKHFIPHNTITCVHQREDVIACILLLFNPVTKCPLHVHAYRCDSLETATMLRGQLQMLIEKPENQKKFAEIESRLLPQHAAEERRVKGKDGKKERLDSSIGSSDTGTSTKSESSEERFSSDVRVATLYDSVAAELRAKLNKNDVPILLPPRDYDTVHRQKGNLTGIELRRCLNANIVGHVGQNGKAKRMASSGGSSGIGSDHAPSPESPDVQERYHDGHSTSDEDWNADQDTGLYLIDQPTYPSPLPKYDYRAEQRKPRQFDQKVTRQHLEEHIRKKLEQRNKYDKYHEQEVQYRNERNAQPRSPAKEPARIFKDEYNARSNTGSNTNRERDREREYQEREYQERHERFSYESVEDTLKRQVRGVKDNRHERYRDASPNGDVFQDNFSVLQFSPRERFNDAKEKFLLLEKKSTPPQEFYTREMPIAPNICKDKRDRNSKYYDDEPIPAPRNMIPERRTDRIERIEHPRNTREGQPPLERYRANQTKEKYDVKRRSMFNLSTSTSPAGDRDRDYYYDKFAEDAARTLNKDYKEYKRRSYMEQRDQSYRDDFATNPRETQREPPREFQEFKDARDARDAREYRDVREQDLRASREHDFRDGREGVRDLREKKFAANQHQQRYRNSYAEPESRKYPAGGGGPPRTRYDILHRTNSTVSNNGRVGIASVHPY